MQTDFDVVVVGAGPAGALAAYTLKNSGFKVLVVDRHEFPREKPCGGGVTIKALKLLPYSIAPTIERLTKSVGIGVKSSGQTSKFETFEDKNYICSFVVRSNFDKFNFDRMIDCGVQFQKDPSLERVEEEADKVVLTFKSMKVTAKYLIGADGANSLVRRLIHSKAHYFTRGFAIEGLVPYQKLKREPAPEFFFGYVKNGYGWVFPKGDHANVGIYTFDENTTLSKEQLRAYSNDRLGTDVIEHIVGFPLGFGGHRYAMAHSRILLVGDAAGFCEPLFGEGIHNALKSGIAAANAISHCESKVSSSLRVSYRQEIRPIVSDLFRCEEMKTFFYRNIEGAGFSALNFPLSRYALMKGFAAGMTMDEITNKFFLAPLFSPANPSSIMEFLRPPSQSSQEYTAA